MVTDTGNTIHSLAGQAPGQERLPPVMPSQNLRLIDLDVVPPGGAQSPLPLESRIAAQPADFGGMAEERRLIAQTAAAADLPPKPHALEAS